MTGEKKLLKIVYHLHAYVPEHNAGAEWMAHAILKWLVSEGHECHVLTTCAGNYEIDGVKVFQDGFEECQREWRWADVGFTHLMRAGKAWNWSSETRTPIVYVVHNTFTNRLVEFKRDFALLYNTDWAKQDGIDKSYQHPNVVVHPPVWFNDYHTTNKKREYITLINCWDRKGGQVLVDLAESMPEYKFMGVLGGYGEQIQKPLSNLHYVVNTPHIKEIYAQTRILIMPSVYESYGRTAVEAMCSGIPVVASGTPGLMESLGDCGLFTPEVQDAAFLKAEPFREYIYQLNDKSLYNDLSLKGIQRAKEFEVRNVEEMKSLEAFLTQFVQWKIDTNNTQEVWPHQRK